MSTITRESGTHGADAVDTECHLVCDCDPDRALCGSDRSGRPHLPDGTAVTCVVCAAMEFDPCPYCGK